MSSAARSGPSSTAAPRAGARSARSISHEARLEINGAPVIGLHDTRHRDVYINALPGAGQETFPVGTMIVKRGGELHAMVKPCNDNILDCNACHLGAADNDYVHSIRLR
jgi:hypothetical protein